jgi:hypothetical protein
MFNTRRMWLPALLGAFFMSRSRGGRNWLNAMGRTRSYRGWSGRGSSRGGLLSLLFGSRSGRRNSAFRLLR